MGKLLLLFVIVPAAELALLIQAGIYLGTWPTLALIVFTGIVGAYLARRQGLSVLTRAQEQMDRGELPAGSLADGVMILVAGALLMTPGILTDAFGFSLLVPGFRNLIKDTLLARFRKAVEENRLHVHVSGMGFDARLGPGGGQPTRELRARSAEIQSALTASCPKIQTNSKTHATGRRRVHLSLSWRAQPSRAGQRVCVFGHDAQGR